MYGEEEYTLAGTSTDSPDKWPEKTDVVVVLNDVRAFETEKNGQKLKKLSISFTTTTDNPPSVAGRSKDSVHPITGATENNKYWTQQFLLALKIPVEVVQSARGLDQLIQVISQFKGRKYIMKASLNDAGYQNIQPNSIRPYIVPGTTEQATYQPPTPPPVAPAPAAAPVVDPWSNTPQPPVANAPQVNTPAPATAVDPWASQVNPAAPVTQPVNPTVAADATATPAPATVTQPTPVAPATPDAAPAKTPEQLEYEKFQAWQAMQAQQNQAPANTPQQATPNSPPSTPAPQGTNVEDEAKSFLEGLGGDLTSSI